jgi:hypothetical protein
MQETSKVTGLFIVCRTCKVTVLICRSCYRGHTYCNNICRDFGYKERRKIARLRYAASPEARLDHCDRNRVYRKRCKSNEKILNVPSYVGSKNTVMDKGSVQSLHNLYSKKEFAKPATYYCHLCGQKVTELHLRRGYENLELFTFIPD